MAASTGGMSDSGAPTRHSIRWEDAEFTDAAAVDRELRRVFDICHGCRRCFNLCDSFPRLFDLIDGSATGELDSVDSAGFAPVVDACTLCDMCFMTKCPYVPPHEFDLDFPHLMLRAKAAERASGGAKWTESQLRKTDRNGKLGTAMASLANWATKEANRPARRLIEMVAGVHRKARLPTFARETLARRAKRGTVARDESAPAHGRKAVLYGTCHGNYNKTSIGLAARAVLARNGVQTEVVHPGCCGMPQLEIGDLAAVAASASAIAASFAAWIRDGYEIVALTPSCALMLKFEWPLIVPDNENVKKLAAATRDVTEYVVDIARTEGLAAGLEPVPGRVALHLACHSRAQNMGAKAAELLRLIPGSDVTVIERCSGHGGAWGVEKQHFEVALKVGRPVARRAVEADPAWISSECPLAADHIAQGVEAVDPSRGAVPTVHPVELLARSYGLTEPT